MDADPKKSETKHRFLSQQLSLLLLPVLKFVDVRIFMDTLNPQLIFGSVLTKCNICLDTIPVPIFKLPVVYVSFLHEHRNQGVHWKSQDQDVFLSTGMA